MKANDLVWHWHVNAINEAFRYPARLSKDGTRVLCSGLHKADMNATGEETDEEWQALFRCGGELGVIKTIQFGRVVTVLRNGEPVQELAPLNAFILHADFGPGSDTIYRKTNRSHRRMFGPGSIPDIDVNLDDSLNSGNFCYRHVRSEKKSDSPLGKSAEFKLPIAIRCPKCKGLNCITEQLIESAPLQIEEK